MRRRQCSIDESLKLGYQIWKPLERDIIERSCSGCFVSNLRELRQSPWHVGLHEITDGMNSRAGLRAKPIDFIDTIRLLPRFLLVQGFLGKIQNCREPAALPNPILKTAHRLVPEDTQFYEGLQMIG